MLLAARWAPTAVDHVQTKVRQLLTYHASSFFSFSLFLFLSFPLSSSLSFSLHFLPFSPFFSISLFLCGILYDPDSESETENFISLDDDLCQTAGGISSFFKFIGILNLNRMISKVQIQQLPRLVDHNYVLFVRDLQRLLLGSPISKQKFIKEDIGCRKWGWTAIS